MKKKVIVSTSVFVLIVGLIILLSFTAFSLKGVEVDFRTSHPNIAVTDEEIVESGDFAKGGSVFFHGKKEYIEKIENSHPYINVINIETVFPSKFVVHIAERQEIYAVAFDEGVYICDEEFRVLKIESSYLSTQSNAMLLYLQENPQATYKEGDYLELGYMPEIYQALFECNRTLGEQIELIESITLSSEFNNALQKNENVATLKLFSGQTIKIVNTKNNLVKKVKLMLDVFSQLFNYIGKTLSTEQGEVILTDQHLKICTIVINNYLHPDKINDVYFDIKLN